MQFIVDYNNIEFQIRRLGPRLVVERILRAIDLASFTNSPRANFRFYDGWYEIQNLTNLAQQFSVDLQRDFPTTFTISGTSNSTPVRIIATAIMAVSLQCDSANNIWHTYRPRSGQGNVRCVHPSTVGCVNSACPSAQVSRFFSSQACTDPNCSILAEDLVVRNEQKLVDSMMSVDLITSHLQTADPICIVSSDDDLWPAIKLLLTRGNVVYHVHTKPNRQTPAFYVNRVSRNQYRQFHL